MSRKAEKVVPFEADASRPHLRRLMITDMKLENFKSYAGEQRIGPFHKKFSAIVGPNGSGKSNVIDAMLFVFGKKAKQIRLDKIASLIHKSDKHPNLKEGRVTVYFQEIIDYTDSQDEFVPVPGTELNVSRSATHNGQSSYYVNGRKSTHADVTKLLKGKGIDLDHNRFLILQGEVEQISLMKPKALNDNEEGLLEYIEDIIGTQHYRPQIEVGLTAVDKLTEEREMHVKRVQQAEADREALEGAKLEAEEFLRLEVKLCKQRGVFIQVKKEAMGADLKQKEATLEEHQTEFNEKRKEGNELKKSLQEHEDNLKLEKKSGDKLMKTFEKEQDVYRKLDANTAKQHANLEHSRKTVEKSQAAKKKATEELTRSEQALASAESDLQENTDEHEALNTKLATDTQKYETQTEALQEKLRPLRASYEGLKKEIAPFADKVSKLEQKCRLLNKEKEFTKNDDQIRDIRGRIAKEQRNLAETGSRVGQYEDQIKIGTAELEKRKEVHSKENARLKLSSSTLPQVRAKEQQELAEVESLKKQLQELGSETAVSKALKRLKQQGGLDGYYGRLGDLGKIDDKYSAAVTSAGGGHLNALVVDGEATAQKILTYLKDNSIGRASTLLLDHQQRIFGEHIKKPFTPPPSQEECVRLYDMIEPCHEKFATAFYSAVRDTLVANSIDGATKLAFADKRTRHRVVTLKGELIEQTGTMTGGGRVPAGGDGMKSYQVSAEDQEQLRKKLEATQHRLEQANTDARQLSAQIHDSKNKLHAHQAACKETQNLLTSRTQEHQQEVEKAAQIEATLKTLSAEETLLLDKMKADEEKIRKIEETCHAAETELEAARNEKKVKDSQIEALEAEMDKTGGAAYTKLKQAIKTNTERCNELDKAISKATATINTSKKQITQRKKAVDTHEKTLIAAQKHLDSLDEVDEEDSEKIKEAKLKVKEIKKEIDEQKKRTEKVEKLRNQAKTALNDRKTEENKAQHELKSRKSDVDHAQAQIAKLTDTLNNIDEALRKSIDEYGTTILDPDEVEDPTTFDHTTYTVILPIEELETYDQTQVKRTIQRLEETQKKLSPNVKALAEWKEKNNVLLKRSSDLKVVSDQRTEAQTAVELLKKSRHDEFMTGFLAITYKLKEMYQMLTMGGDAELELVDTFDPFTEGLQFSVRPPKKSWKHISNLSGGEKTLSSLALVFALHHFKPTPLYVMDEIDAALDFKNVSIVANYVTSAASNAQFIIISLRNNMFELANRLVGICKTENCTKSAAINPALFTKLLPAVPEAEKVNNGGVVPPPAFASAPMPASQGSESASQRAKRALEDPAELQAHKLRRVSELQSEA